MSDVIERAHAWLQAADERGINVTDENGYLAVIFDLVAEVETLRGAIDGYRNEQVRLIDQGRDIATLVRRLALALRNAQPEHSTVADAAVAFLHEKTRA